MPICGAGIPNTLGMEDTGASVLSATTHSLVVANIPRRAASGTLPVWSCRGYKSVSQVLGRQACMAALKASMKAW